MLTTSSHINNPALLYILGLGSKASRETTQRKLTQVAGLYQQTLEAFPWSQLTPIQVQLIISEFENQGLSYTTINALLSALKGVAKQAWRNGDMDGDVLARIKDIPNRKGSRLPVGQALETDVVNRLIKSVIQNSHKNQLVKDRDVALIAIGFFCGLRRSELGAIRIEHLDMIMQELRVIGKGNKERKVPIPTKIIPYINQWIKSRNEQIIQYHLKGDYLFGQINARGSGKLLTLDGLLGNAILVILKKACVASGIAFDKLPTPHDMRRTAVTKWLQKGDARVAQALAGHEHIQTTIGYARDDLSDKMRHTVE